MHRTRGRLGPTLHNFINGSFRSSLKTPPNMLENINPFTGEVINHIPASTAQDIHLAISSASTAFPHWSSLPSEERADKLLSLAREIEKNAEEFALAESRDTGKPLSLARNVDIDRGIHNFRFFAEALRSSSKTEKQLCYEQSIPQEAVHHIRRRPVGVAALISPWNLPLYLLTWKIAPALAAGCTVVAKPSEFTPTTASLLAEASVRAGIPPGVLNIVHGLGADVGEALVTHKDIKAVSFTGGTATGAIVAKNAAPHFKKVSLELGGKNPAVILADANIDEAVKGVIRSSFLNSGQICLCSSRILVHESIHDEFLDRLIAGVKGLNVGDPMDPKVDLGPVVSRGHLNKIASCVDKAVADGAQVALGGPAAFDSTQTACFYPPTILTGVQQDWDIIQEEVFGPVVTVQQFASHEEALRLANGVKYGLAASVWTRPDFHTGDTSSNARTREVMQFTEQLDCGMIWVNCWLLRDLRVPFGGSKASGLGREGGEHSFEFFSEVSSICLASPAPIPALPGKMTSSSSSRTTATILDSSKTNAQTPSDDVKSTMPKPVGKYVHAKAAGGLLFLAGVGPRSPVDNSIPGGPTFDEAGNPLEYDCEAQTRATIENVIATLEASGSSLEKVVDVQCFLIDMKRDFATFNKVYSEYFSSIDATRTCIAIRAMPSPIAVEMKVVALP